MAWTFDSLSSAILAWNETNSTDFVANVSNFIRLAETRIYRDTNLRITVNSVTGSLTSGVQEYALPTTFISTVELTLPTVGAGALEMRHQTWLKEAYKTANQAQPKYFGLVTNNFMVAPTPNTTYSYVLSYKAHPEFLGTSTNGTWVSRNAEDLLLKACMVEATKFNKHMNPIEAQGPSETGAWERDYLIALDRFRVEHEGKGYTEERDRGDKKTV